MLTIMLTLSNVDSNNEPSDNNTTADPNNAK